MKAKDAGAIAGVALRRADRAADGGSLFRARPAVPPHVRFALQLPDPAWHPRRLSRVRDVPPARLVRVCSAGKYYEMETQQGGLRPRRVADQRAKPLWLSPVPPGPAHQREQRARSGESPVSSPTTSPQTRDAPEPRTSRRAAPGTPAGEQPIRSYTSPGQGGATRCEFWSRQLRDARRPRRPSGRDAQNQIEDCRPVPASSSSSRADRLKGLQDRRGGCRQSLRRAREFAVGNDVTATDLDVAAHGLDVRAYLEVLRRNARSHGPRPSATRLFGTDRVQPGAGEGSTWRACPTPGSARWTRRGWSSRTTRSTWCTRWVFEHLPDPEAVWRVRPRGQASRAGSRSLLHLYTSDSRLPRFLRTIIRGDHSQTGYWPHLREGATHGVQTPAYLNELTLAQSGTTWCTGSSPGPTWV